MKNKEEIEELVLEKFKHKMYNPFFNVAFVEGYTQCQEDMADKKYTEEDMLQCWNACLDFNKPAGLDSGINYKNFINSLNKQD